MTEPTEPQQPEQSAPEAQPEQQQNVNELPPWAREAITKANREAANYRTQVNELKPLADQFRQLDEASKSEQQRMQESLEASNRERDNNAAEAMRMRVAIEHGISKEDLDLLGTGSQDELTARAARVAELRSAASAAQQPPAVPPTQRTVQDLRPGATPSAPPSSEKDALYAELFGADNTQQ